MKYVRKRKKRTGSRNDSCRSSSRSDNFLSARLRKRNDIILIAVSLALCGMNILIRPYLSGIPALISACWFKDIFGAAVFTAYTDLLICLCGADYSLKLAHILLLMLFCGFVWEVITPLFRADTVGDPADAAAYCLGGTIYRTWMKFMTEKPGD